MSVHIKCDGCGDEARSDDVPPTWFTVSTETFSYGRYYPRHVCSLACLGRLAETWEGRE